MELAECYLKPLFVSFEVREYVRAFGGKGMESFRDN